MIRAILDGLAWLFQGRVCPRCHDERTGHWERDALPLDPWLCTTCTVVERIRFREAAAKWMDRHSKDR